MELSESVMAYKVFRNISLDEESYSVQLELKHGLDDEESEQIILEAAEKEFLEVVKDSDPRRYRINYEKMEQEWFRLWEEEMGEKPREPKNFRPFLKSYCRAYMEREKHSTIREMLVEEFFLGLSQASSQAFLTNDLIELKERMEQNFQGKRPSHEYIRHALNHR